MSLILEALRKSEAERRRGQAPDLLSEAAPVIAAPRTALPRHWPWLLAGMAAAAGAALVLRWPGETARVAPPVATRAEVRDVASSRDADAGTVAPRRAAAPVPEAAADERRTAPAAQAGAAIAAAAPGADTRASASTAASALREPVPASTPPAAPPRVDPRAPAVARIEPAPTPSPPPARSEPAPAETLPAPVATAFASPTLPLRLSELSGEERQQLPALKVSMHMWTPDAGNRFAIIDGARVNEGDRIGEATVEAIQQDGVMLSWRGRQIRLPLR